jgi:hypothetical protein
MLVDGSGGKMLAVVNKWHGSGSSNTLAGWWRQMLACGRVDSKGGGRG